MGIGDLLRPARRYSIFQSTLIHPSIHRTLSSMLQTHTARHWHVTLTEPRTPEAICAFVRHFPTVAERPPPNVRVVCQLLARLPLCLTITATDDDETHVDSIHRSTRATMRDSRKYRIQIVRTPCSLPALVGHARGSLVWNSWCCWRRRNRQGTLAITIAAVLSLILSHSHIH